MKDSTARRFGCWIGVFVLCCALLVGCATPVAPDGTGQSAANTIPIPHEDRTQALVYLSEEKDTRFGDLVYSVENFVLSGDRLWSLGVAVTPDEDGSGYLLLSTGPDGGDAAHVPFQYPAFPMDQQLGVYTCHHIGLVVGGQGALYSVDACLLSGELDDEEDDRYYYFLSTVGADGRCADTRQLSVPAEAVPTAHGDLQICMVEDTVYLPTTAGIYRLPPEGEAQLLDYQQGLYPSALLPMADGTLLLAGQVFPAEGGSVAGDAGYLCTIDATTTSLEGLSPMPVGLYDVTTRLTTGADGTLWLWNDGGIYRFDVQAGTAEPVCRWLDSSIDATALLQVQPLGNGGFLTVSQAEQYAPLLFSVLTKASMDRLADRTVVTLGMDSTNQALRDAILAFNKGHDDVYVQVIDYSVYTNSANNFNGGADLLQSDIINNKAPDILLLPNNMAYHSYVQKGLFCDLYPMLDADVELSKEDIAPCVRNACAYGDTLPTILPSYWIFTLSGATAQVGEKPGWDLAAFHKLLQDHPAQAPIFNCDRHTALLYLTLLGGKDLIDYTTGSCHLDSDSFVSILEHCAAYPEEMPDMRTDQAKDRVARGDGLLAVEYVTSFFNLRGTMSLFDGAATYIGFPNDSGNCGSAVIPQMQIGITSYCENPDAAWQFVRSLLLPDAQRQLSQGDYLGALPARVDILNEMADAAQTRQERIGTLPFYLTAGGGDLELLTRPLTEAEADQVLRLTQDAGVLYQYDAAIDAILQEEADAYYNGQRSAAEAAKIIQDRVQTYLSENS